MHSIDLPRPSSPTKRPPGASSTAFRRARILVGTIVLILLAGVGLEAGRFLVVNAPRPADVIVVLAGGADARPAKAIELAAEGYAPRVIVDVSDRSRFYGRTELELAREWANSQPVPTAICPIHGLSTKEESHDLRWCLEALHAKKVLIVTSDFHTRRAFSTLRRELPGYQFSIAAAYDPTQFGARWWQQREWTKTTFYEWTRLVWWKLVDQWS